MAVPDFQSLMAPFLQCVGDGSEHEVSEAAECVAQRVGLSDDDRREMLKSGQTRLYNRVAWDRTYFVKAGLLERTGRGRFRITDRGKALLATNPKRVDIKLLRQYPEFVAFQNKHHGSDSDSLEEVAEVNQTPEDLLESSYRSLMNDLADEVLERVKQCPPAFFEQLVVDLLVAMGYGGSLADAGSAVGRSGDGGIDGVIKEDKLGLDAVYVQAKRWEGNVSRPTVQAFVGSLEGRKARKGVLITTSGFTKDAMRYTEAIDKRVVLIDGTRLAQLMIEHDVGVTETARYSLKRLDEDYYAGNI
jgi:restriction system protein